MSFERLTPVDCINRCVDPMTATSDVIVVASNMTSTQNNGSSLIDGAVSGWWTWDFSTTWICQAYYSPSGPWRFCNADFASTFADDWNLPSPGSRVHVDYCLAGTQADNEQRCGMHYSMPILILVCVCTSLESLLIWYTWYQHRRAIKGPNGDHGATTMVTMGDLICSYLQRPESQTGPAQGKELDNLAKPGSFEVKTVVWQTESRVSWHKVVRTRSWAISIGL